MKNIKVMFRGHKSPSGMDTEKEYMIGEARFKKLQADGRYIMDYDIPAKPKKEKKAPKVKKEKK